MLFPWAVPLLGKFDDPLVQGNKKARRCQPGLIYKQFLYDVLDVDQEAEMKCSKSVLREEGELRE
jgi:hypothetical protein